MYQTKASIEKGGGGLTGIPADFRQLFPFFLCARGPTGVVSIELVLKVMLLSDGSQSSVSVLTLTECLI